MKLGWNYGGDKLTFRPQTDAYLLRVREKSILKGPFQQSFCNIKVQAEEMGETILIKADFHGKLLANMPST